MSLCAHTKIKTLGRVRRRLRLTSAEKRRRYLYSNGNIAYASARSILEKMDRKSSFTSYERLIVIDCVECGAYRDDEKRKEGVIEHILHPRDANEGDRNVAKSAA